MPETPVPPGCHVLRPRGDLRAVPGRRIGMRSDAGLERDDDVFASDLSESLTRKDRRPMTPEEYASLPEPGTEPPWPFDPLDAPELPRAPECPKCGCTLPEGSLEGDECDKCWLATHCPCGNEYAKVGRSGLLLDRCEKCVADLIGAKLRFQYHVDSILASNDLALIEKNIRVIHLPK